MPPETADTPEPPRPNLKPAAENPWYVLATIHGEQTAELRDLELHAKNRRIWNGWCCGQLSAPKRAQLAKTARLTGEDFAPLTESERALVRGRFDALGLGSLTYWHMPDFCSTRFTNPINMSGFFFNGANFSDSVSEESADFSFTIFYNLLFFNSTEFNGKAEFYWAKFNEPIFFNSTQFKSKATFQAAEFEHFAHFTYAIFGDIADFQDSQFERPASFRETRFLTDFPALTGAILHPSTTFTAKDECWPKSVDAPAEKSRESLAIIRHTVGKQGLPEEGHYFFRREMAFAARIGSPFRRFPCWAFGVVSDFGNSLARPAIGLGLVGYVGLVVYWNWLAWYAPDNLDFAGPFRTAAGFSVAQLFGFLGFTGSYFGTGFLDALPTALKVLAGFQTVAGVVLLFFLGLGLRNRFRLK